MLKHRLVATAVRAVVAAAILTVGFAALPAAADPSKPKPTGVQECKKNHATYGFTSEAECKRHVAQGGTLVVPATTSLTITPIGDPYCSTGDVGEACHEVVGTGLMPDSTVAVVYDITYLYPTNNPTSVTHYAVVDEQGNTEQTITHFFCDRDADSQTYSNLRATGYDPEGNTVYSDVIEDPCATKVT